MERDISGEVNERLRAIQAEREQALRERQQEAARIEFLRPFKEQLNSREGVLIKDAYVISEQARRSIAGMVLSLRSAGITPPEVQRHQADHINKPIRGMFTKQTLRAWALPYKLETKIHESGYEMGTEYTVERTVLVSTDFRLYSHFINNIEEIDADETVIHNAVVNKLAKHETPWVEPPEETWKSD